MNATNENSHEGFTISSNWDVQAKHLKEKFSSLTDADLKYEPGKENELLSKVEARLHKNRDEVITIIKNLDSGPGEKQHLSW